MLMKKLVTYLSIVCCWIAWLSTASCTQNEENTEVNDTSTLYVTFSTRASEPDPLLRSREGIRTLRLILIQEGKVLRNYQEDFGADGQPVVQKTITFLGIPNKSLDIYAVANESSIDMSSKLDLFTPGSKFDNNKKAELLNTVIINKGRNIFPRTEEKLTHEDRYLPMAGQASWSPDAASSNKKQYQVNVSLVRAVAKMEIIFNNQTGAPFHLTEINWGASSATQCYLYGKPIEYDAQGNPTRYEVPSDVSYQTHSITIPNGGIMLANGIEIDESTKEAKKLIVYSLESNASSYQLGLNNNVSSEYPLTPIKDASGQEITSLWRNTCLRVTATIRSAGMELNCKINPWDLEDYEVNYKDQLSYEAGQWTEGTYLDKDPKTHTLILNPDKEAELKFLIQSPTIVFWSASLTNPTDFQFVGPNSGKVQFDENNKPIAQSIKISVKNKEEQETKTTALIVTAMIGDPQTGRSYELDLTSGGETNPTGNVNRFTLKQNK